MWFWFVGCGDPTGEATPTDTPTGAESGLETAAPPTGDTGGTHTGPSGTHTGPGGTHTGATTACGGPASWFVPEVVFDTGGDSLAVVTGDMDQDGDDDLLVESYYDEDLVWFEQGAAWAGHPQGFVWKGDAAALALGDLGGDSLPDVVSAQIDDLYYSSANPVKVRVNTAGALGTSVEVDDRSGHGSTAAAVGDVTGDGLAEVVVAQDDGVFVALGRGNGAFGRLVQVGPSLGGRIEVADLDQDGAPDLVGSTGWLRSQGASFAHATFVTVDPVRDFLLADLDGDADLDLARFSTTTAWWEENLGGGALAAPVELVDDPAWDVAGGLALDLDLDGATDLLVVGWGGHRWLRNLGGGQFAAAAPVPSLTCEPIPGYGRVTRGFASLDGQHVVCADPYPGGRLLVFRRQPCP